MLLTTDRCPQPLNCRKNRPDGAAMFVSKPLLLRVASKRRVDDLPLSGHPSKCASSKKPGTGVARQLIGGPKVGSSLSAPGTTEVPGKGKEAAATPDLASKNKKSSDSSGSPGTPGAMTRVVATATKTAEAVGASAKVTPPDDPSRSQSARGVGDAFAQPESGRETAAQAEPEATRADASGLKATEGPTRKSRQGWRCRHGYGITCAHATSRFSAAGFSSTDFSSAIFSSAGFSSASFSSNQFHMPPYRRPRKELAGEDDEVVEEIPRQQRTLLSTRYVPPLQAAWFQGGKAEKDAMMKGFDDSANKEDATVMYEAGLVLLEKMQKIVDRSTAKSEALRSVFDNINEIEQIQRAMQRAFLAAEGGEGGGTLGEGALGVDLSAKEGW
uniref:Uncharacterized protein n=1 Tax=Oryza punctata TaxID=4537 RepID=A0A0E0JY54_ORYPU